MFRMKNEFYPYTISAGNLGFSSLLVQTKQFRIKRCNVTCTVKKRHHRKSTSLGYIDKFKVYCKVIYAWRINTMLISLFSETPTALWIIEYVCFEPTALMLAPLGRSYLLVGLAAWLWRPTCVVEGPGRVGIDRLAWLRPRKEGNPACLYNASSPGGNRGFGWCSISRPISDLMVSMLAEPGRSLPVVSLALSRLSLFSSAWMSRDLSVMSYLSNLWLLDSTLSLRGEIGRCHGSLPPLWREWSEGDCRQGRGGEDECGPLRPLLWRTRFILGE